MSGPLALTLWGWAMRLAAPLLLLRWWWRGRAEPGYRETMAERLGWYRDAPESPGRLWVHAVSLGETLAAAPLIDALRERQPGLRLLMTHTTATGREAARKLLGPGDALAWLPLDTPGAVRRFLRHWRPSQGVLMETEVWPTLLAACERAGVPVTLANARLSERSLRKGVRTGALMRDAAARLTGVLAQTEADAERLRAMGARRVAVAGNLKFDTRPEPALLLRGRGWREAAGRPVVLLAVSREGEEADGLRAWAAASAQGAWGGAPPLLLVVPRHPQRFDEVAALLAAAGLRVARRSQWGDGPARRAPDGGPGAGLDGGLDAGPHTAADAWLGDSLGEMPAYYAAADVALLGGSFAPLGGQNLIQAASCACPLLMGPHTFNFAQAAQAAIDAGAAMRVQDFDEALVHVRRLLADVSARRGMAEAGLRFAAAHQGAAQRMAQQLLSG